MPRLWDKGQPVDALVLAYTAGDDPLLDRRLVPYDVRASIAHAQMLRDANYLSDADFESTKKALTDLAASFARGEWTISLDEEDCHTALENRLVAAVGEAGRRIHLGRSRNDQVLVALRLYLKDAVHELLELGLTTTRALADLAAREGSIELPGYTHGQRAMPSSVALWANAFRSEIEDDLEGLRSTLRRLDKNPLGSAAGYGVPVLGLDRSITTRLLHFAAPHEPVTAVQLSRGKAEAQIVFELCLLMQDIGRLAADLCLFATQEFAFVRLPERFTTGSSIMPQKRNPDLFELMRARSAQLPSDLTAILSITAKLPSGYHRDLQLLKSPLFRALDISHDTLALLTHALPSLSFDPTRCHSALDPTLYATEKAFLLVRDHSIPFRDAYHQIAQSLLDASRRSEP